MITRVAVHGYRSIRDLVVPLGRITLITGANGTGKSNLYRALRLAAGIAHGRLISSLAAEGGLDRVLWAGPETPSAAMRRGEVPVEGTARRRGPVSLMLGVTTEDLGYVVDLGLPSQEPGASSVFLHDPEIKREAVFTAPLLRPAAMIVDRRWSWARVREDGRWCEEDLGLSPRQSIIEELADHRRTPELLALRRLMAAWRFHDGLRTDPGAPARRPCIATRTDVLADDGSDLAAAVGTVLESAWAQPFTDAVSAALDGSRVGVVATTDGRLRLEVHQHGLLRPLDAAEISDGSLRLIMLATALCSPAPPSLLVLNEPEASLHPSVLPALAGLVKQAARRTQIVIVSHDVALAEALQETGGDEVVHHELIRVMGGTTVAGRGLLTTPEWSWGTRRPW